MQYKCKLACDTYEPSQEFLGIAVLIGAISVLSIGYIGVMLSSKDNSKKTIREKIDELAKLIMLKSSFEPGNLDHFPEKYGMSDAASDKANGGHFAIDSNSKHPKIKSDNIVSLSTYISVVKRLISFINQISSISDFTNSEALIATAFNKSFYKEMLLIKGTKVEGFVLKSNTVTWPDNEYYQDADKCINTMLSECKALNPVLKRISNIVKNILSNTSVDDAKEELAGKQIYLKSCETTIKLIEWIVSDFKENFYRMNDDLDVVFIDGE